MNRHLSLLWAMRKVYIKVYGSRRKIVVTNTYVLMHDFVYRYIDIEFIQRTSEPKKVKIPPKRLV
jgi:hypothetical protein